MNTFVEASGHPWWLALIGATVLTRMVLLPVTIKQQQWAARLQRAQPELKGLQDKMMKLRASGDAASFDPKEMFKEQRRILAKYEAPSLLMNFVPAFMTGFAFITLFRAVDRLCKSDLPAMALQGGFHVGTDGSAVSLNLTDLCAPDPTYLITGASGAFMLGAMEIMMRDMIAQNKYAKQSSPLSPEMMLKGGRVLALFGCYVISGQPAGVQLVVLTQAIMQLAQVLMLRPVPVRKALGLPLNPEREGRYTDEELAAMREKGVEGRDQIEVAQSTAAVIEAAGGLEQLKKDKKILRGGKVVTTAASSFSSSKS